MYLEGFVGKHTSDYTYNSLLKYRSSGRNKCKDEKQGQTWNQEADEIKNLREKMKKIQNFWKTDLCLDSELLTTGFYNNFLPDFSLP